ncbi:MAG: cyclic-phosphate processing receiver domain-containing protein [Phycisphaeraceae bacterium]
MRCSQEIRELEAQLPNAAVISLDHDLYSNDATAPDPGDGLDVARWLAALAPSCPVLIHSSNVERANMMMGELTLGGWDCRRIAPLGDDWIETDWAVVVRQLLNCEYRSDSI